MRVRAPGAGMAWFSTVAGTAFVALGVFLLVRTDDRLPAAALVLFFGAVVAMGVRAVRRGARFTVDRTGIRLADGRRVPWAEVTAVEHRPPEGDLPARLVVRRADGTELDWDADDLNRPVPDIVDAARRLRGP